MLTLDGSTLEGGGQLVRVALSISAICSIPVRITKIRANRAAKSSRTTDRGRGTRGRREARGEGGEGRGGGLKESHLAALNWLADKCHADVEGDQVGCTEVMFRPGRRKVPTSFGICEKKTDGGEVEVADRAEDKAETEMITLENPGSVWLVWQAIFPYIVFSMLRIPDNSDGASLPVDRVETEHEPQCQFQPQDQHSDSDSTNLDCTHPEHEDDNYQRDERGEPLFKIILKGGTNVPKSPSTEYMQQVFLPFCWKIGLPRVDIHVRRRGWAGSAPEIGEIEVCVFKPRETPRVTPESKHEARSESRARADESTSGHQDGGGGHGSENETGKEKATITANLAAKTDPETKTHIPFCLPPFNTHDPGPITHITMTILSGSPTTQHLLQSELISGLRARPIFSSSSSPSLPDPIPITIHASSGLSGDERRLYVLLVAHTANGYKIGRDHLGSGRKLVTEADRRKIVTEVVGYVVREFERECERVKGGRCVDEFAEDQIVVFQALGKGKSSVDVGSSRGEGKVDGGSLHTRTVRWVCEEMLGTVFDGVGGCEGKGRG
ncbi:uncharacterized protein Z518_02775 [Rhinocladiella mackenziei CBS 650.93]|uniref:RNA 3'-terminal phosphate cyclase domain-containing protein n=1 Tax=Rhinocladiella mackenziei CBS 650.93 TaxID=1442369 RepID=A0A0D2IQD1_9EURO|nr:uncharacterized protein Z518_02775 [Rhinocladiella mackenziei CBS 650.93]KIX08119.1 hypothetical protein Z518_02775 [Rhinocladiella mackenziei CBS 650.93]